MGTVRLLPSAEKIEEVLTASMMPSHYRKLWYKANTRFVDEVLKALDEVNIVHVAYLTRDIAAELGIIMFEMWKLGYKVRWIHPSLELLFKNNRPTFYVYDAVHAVEDQDDLADFIELYGHKHKHLLVSPYKLNKRLNSLVEAICGSANS